MSSGLILSVVAATGTGLAAVITGFGAAALKHRWDVAGEDTRWARESLERRRQELLLSLAEYLRVRTQLHAALGRYAQDGSADRTLVVDVLNELELAAARARMLLAPGDRQLLSQDVSDLHVWSSAAMAAIQKGQPFNRPPEDDQFIELGQRLLLQQ